VVAFFYYNIMTFKVLKQFYTHSNKKTYKVNETIELTKDEALGMLTYGYLEEVKEVKEVKEPKTKK